MNPTFVTHSGTNVMSLEHIFFKKSFHTHDLFMISQTNRCMPGVVAKIIPQQLGCPNIPGSSLLKDPHEDVHKAMTETYMYKP